MPIAVYSGIDTSQTFKSLNSKKADSTSPGFGVQGKSSKKWPFKECDVFWHTAQVTTPPSSHTPGMLKLNYTKNNYSNTYPTAGLIQLLHKGLLQGHSRGTIRRAVLCNEKVVHIRRELWDAGWGCG